MPTPSSSFQRRPSLMFALRGGSLPLTVLLVLGLLYLAGGSVLGSHERVMTSVVETDLNNISRLAAINSRLQIANARVYRLMTLVAAERDVGDIRQRVETLNGDIEGIVGDLQRYRVSQAEPQQEAALDDVIHNLELYGGAVKWMGSMLEIDFPTAVAFMAPFNAHIDTISRQFSTIIAESTARDVGRTASATQDLHKAINFYAFAAALVCLLVSIFAWRIGKRQQRLVHDTVKLEQKVAERTAALNAAKVQAEEATQAKSRFLASMSHEIRTPMNAVMTLAKLLQRTRLSAEQAELAEVMLTSAESLLTIIDDILDFSKIEAGRLDLDPAPFSLNELVKEVVQLMAPRAAEKGLDLISFVDPAGADGVIGDKPRLRQILVNLLGNAVKFTDGGHVVIEAGQDPRGSGSLVRFSVSDTGIGIPADQQDRLFQPFVQADSSTARRYGGTGLGLSICWHLVNLMGGEIGLDSVPGMGSTFWFTVDCPPVYGEKPLPRHVLAGVRVTVLARTLQIGDFWCRYLQDLGAIAKAADGVAAAIDDCRLGLEDGKPCRLVLADDTVDGVSRLPEMLAKQLPGADIRCISVAPVAADGPPPAGFASCLSKPLRRDRLGDDLAAVVSGKPKAPASGKTAEPMPPDFLPPEREEAAALGVLILVAEDNPTNQMVMDRLMGKLGYAIDLAGNGGEALEKLKASRYGLLLTDCHMPGMDGFSLAARIRETEAGGGRHLPIIALTGDALEGTAQKCLDAGMDDYLSKPIAIDKLDLAIRRWLPEAAAARRLVQPAALPLFRDA